MFKTNRQLWRLGLAYEQLIVAHDFGFDTLFGPAYKGIPIATVTASALLLEDEWEINVCFNRKIEKGHGEGGRIIGELKPDAKVVIVDDVITDGATKYEAINLIREAGAEVTALIIAFDRLEYGKDETLTAVESFTADTGVPVFSIATVENIIKVLLEQDRHETAKIIADYLVRYEAVRSP